MKQKLVIFIHGILGHPDHFNNFYPLVNKDFAIRKILLSGHGKTVDDFARASMRDWKNEVESFIQEAENQYSSIYIVAHSMGTLFALQSIRNHKKIKGLFLLASPLYLWVRIRPLLAQWRRIFFPMKADRTSKNIYDKPYHAHGVQFDKRFWKYIKWLPNYLALFREIRNTRDELVAIGHTPIPCIAFHSGHDELVHAKACKALEKFGAEVILLPDSTHYLYDEKDLQILSKKFEDFLSGDLD